MLADRGKQFASWVGDGFQRDALREVFGIRKETRARPYFAK